MLGIVANYVVHTLPNPSKDIGAAAVEWSLWLGIAVTIASYSLDFGNIEVGLNFDVKKGHGLHNIVISDALQFTYVGK